MSDIVTVSPFEPDTAEEAELRKGLEQSDRENTGATPEPEQPKDEADKSESPTDEKQESDSSESEAEHKVDSTGRLHAKDGKFAPKAAKVEKGEVETLEEGKPPEIAPPAPEPDKDEARKARAWQKLQAEKTEVRRANAEAQAALAEIRQLKDQLQRQPQAQTRFGSRDYMQAADEFERQAAQLMKDGDVDQASQKLDLARQSRGQAQSVWQQEQQETKQQQASTFEREWQTHAESAIKEHPELGDPNSEAAHAMMELLEDYPVLGYIPDGFKKGVEILQMRRDSASASELRTENDKLKAEIKELREKTAISGGGVTSKISPKDFDSMSLDEQEAWLMNDARQQDLARTS